VKRYLLGVGGGFGSSTRGKLPNQGMPCCFGSNKCPDREVWGFGCGGGGGGYLSKCLKELTFIYLRLAFGLLLRIQLLSFSPSTRSSTPPLHLHILIFPFQVNKCCSWSRTIDCDIRTHGRECRPKQMVIRGKR
jgi:hypothetical protein